jgi:hypothetical protein
MLPAASQLSPQMRHHRPAADREGSPRPDAADGRAAIVDPVHVPRPGVRSIWDELRSFATIGVLVTANGLATVARFVLLRTWISRRPSHSTTHDQLEGNLS